MSSALIGYFVLPAVAFGLAYFPILRNLSRSLAVAYPKADIRRRAFAAGVDMLLVVTLWWSYLSSGSVGFLIIGSMYAGLRDAIAGRSVGKFLFGVVVIHLGSGQPSGMADSLRRNVVFLVPGANAVALVLESMTIARDPQGQRLGDRMALTQVVDGFGLKDLAESFVRWFSEHSPLFHDASQRPERSPVKADRRAQHGRASAYRGKRNASGSSPTPVSTLSTL